MGAPAALPCAVYVPYIRTYVRYVDSGRAELSSPPSRPKRPLLPPSHVHWHRGGGGRGVERERRERRKQDTRRKRRGGEAPSYKAMEMGTVD